MENNDKTEEIQGFAYCYLSKEEIGIITGIDPLDLNDTDHAHYRAFMKGRLMRKAEFNNSLIQLSKQLSSPAMAIEYKIAENTHLNDLKR